MGREQPIGDPGGVTYYNRETFGLRRYESKVFNSFGHPLPVVAGRLQSEANSIVVPPPVTNFDSDADEIRINLAKAYAEPTLKALTRSLRYNRLDSGGVTVEDRFEYSSPQSFETAITTRGMSKRIDSHTVLFSKGSERLQAKLGASGPFDMTEELISDSGAEFTRIGIRLREPATTGYISVDYTPAD